MKPARDRFEDKIMVDPNSGCWLWTASVDKNGYGKILVAGSLKGAHRFAYETYRGEIPKSLVIDHLCRTPACANPWHLEAVTFKENVRRGRSSEFVTNLNKTRDYPRKSGCPKGHPYSGENLYVSPKGHWACRACQKAAQIKYLERRRAA